ncbi:MAG: hypothetical protein ACLQM8_09450 [Limisphaerales bacterium]
MTVVDTYKDRQALVTLEAFDGWDARQKVEEAAKWQERGEKWFPRYEVRKSNQVEAVSFVLSGEDMHWWDAP